MFNILNLIKLLILLNQIDFIDLGEKMDIHYAPFLVVLPFIFIIALISYILTCLSYKKILEKYDYNNSVYAFIPFYNLYLLTKVVADEYFVLGNISIKKQNFIWWWLIRVAIILLNMPILSKIISLIIKIICLGYLYNKSFKKFDNTYDSDILGYIASIIPIILWIKILPNINDI